MIFLPVFPQKGRLPPRKRHAHLWNAIRDARPKKDVGLLSACPPTALALPLKKQDFGTVPLAARGPTPCVQHTGLGSLPEAHRHPTWRFPVVADIVAKVGEGQLGRNNRIATSKFLNQHCVPAADLESMLLSRMPKIFLQQYRPDSEAAVFRSRVRSLGQSCRPHDVRETARLTRRRPLPSRRAEVEFEESSKGIGRPR
jgi:hypothetical protein